MSCIDVADAAWRSGVGTGCFLGFLGLLCVGLLVFSRAIEEAFE
jgi:hypothetical protein